MGKAFRKLPYGGGFANLTRPPQQQRLPARFNTPFGKSMVDFPFVVHPLQKSKAINHRYLHKSKAILEFFLQ
jgi:hypothetical protein